MERLRGHDVAPAGRPVALRPPTEHDWALSEAISNAPRAGSFSEEVEVTPCTLEQLERMDRFPAPWRAVVACRR